MYKSSADENRKYQEVVLHYGDNEISNQYCNDKCINKDLM